MSEADTTFGTPSWYPDNEGMASKGSQEAVVWLTAQEKGGPPSSQFSNESSSRDRFLTYMAAGLGGILGFDQYGHTDTDIVIQIYSKPIPILPSKIYIKPIPISG